MRVVSLNQNRATAKDPSFKGISVKKIAVSSAGAQLEEVVARIRQNKQFAMPMSFLRSKGFTQRIIREDSSICILENPFFDSYIGATKELENAERLSIKWVENCLSKAGIKIDIEKYNKPEYRVVTLTDKDRDDLIAAYTTRWGGIKRVFAGDASDQIDKALRYFQKNKEAPAIKFMQSAADQFSDKSFFDGFITKHIEAALKTPPEKHK